VQKALSVLRMKEIWENKRYIYDPLYGIINDLPRFVWDVIPCPELQRLREVRLCNINSFCLPGGANINRYEHAVGTCYLAQECLNSWPLLSPIDTKEKERFLLAALLHDVVSAAFGHSVEYIESKEGFDHERAFKYIILGEKKGSYRYKYATLEPIFFGMPRALASKLADEDIEAIGEIVAGNGRFGPLINSTMDLDNIDNVFRLAYHIGLVKSGEVPLKLARSLYTGQPTTDKYGKLILRKEAIPLVEEWHKVRKELYSLLLLNPEEFSAKCMLNEAIEIAKEKAYLPFNWYDVDHELLEKLSNICSESRNIISRLMVGDLYGCMGIFSTTRTDKYESISDISTRKKLELNLIEMIQSRFDPRFKDAMIAIHPILDVNKTERRVCIQTDDGTVVQIGKSSNQLLIGVFFKNVYLNTYTISDIPYGIKNEMCRKISAYLSDVLGDPNLRQLKLYGEIQKL